MLTADTDLELSLTSKWRSFKGVIRFIGGVGGSIIFPFWFWEVPAWVGAAPPAPWATFPFEAACGTCEQCLCALGVRWGSCLTPLPWLAPCSPSRGLRVSSRDALCLTGVGRLPRSWAISQHEAQQRFQPGNAVRQTIKWLRINNRDFTKWVYHFPPLPCLLSVINALIVTAFWGFFTVFWQQSTLSHKQKQTNINSKCLQLNPECYPSLIDRLSRCAEVGINPKLVQILWI